MAWLLASPPTTLAYLLTHSTHSSITTTTTPSTTSYPYALTMVVPVMCTYVSWCPWVCVSLWVSVLLCLLVLQGVAAYSPPTTASRVGAVLLIPPSVVGTIA
jgi:hypothetical protein